MRVWSDALAIVVACFIAVTMAVAADGAKDKDKATARDTASKGSTKKSDPLEDRFKGMDRDGDGKVTLKEFLATPFAKRNGEDRAKDFFKQIDKDGSGFFTLKEYKDFRAKMAAEQTKKDQPKDKAGKTDTRDQGRKTRQKG